MKPNKTVIIKLIFTALTIASVLSLFINKGLFYFELNNHTEVRVLGESLEVNNFINNISDSNPVRIDKINNVIYFESINIEELSSQLSEKNSENKLTFNISQNSFLRDNILKDYSALIVLSIISSIAIFIYFLLRNKASLNSNQLYYLLVSYLTLAFFSNLFLAGTVSLLSRYYQVREVDLISFLFMNLWLSIIFFTALWRLKEINFDDMSSIYASEEFHHNKYITILGVVLAIIAFALGVNFVVCALLIFVSVLYISFSFHNIGWLINFDYRSIREMRSKLKFKRPNVLNKNQKAIVNTSRPSKESVKKKNKQKKRRK